MLPFNANRILLPVFLLFFTLAQSIPAIATVQSFKKDADGVTLMLDKGMMKIKICMPDVVQVKYTILDAFPEKKSMVVINNFLAAVPFTIEEDGIMLHINTSKLRIIVNKTTNAIAYTDLNDNLITSEDAVNKVMKPHTVAGIETYSCETTFNSPKEEALYGLGCHPTDTLSINYKGRNQDMAILYMTGAIPVLLSTKGYGLMWDNYAASNWYGAEEGNTKFRYTSESGQMVDYWFLYGPSLDQVINSYRITTGVAPMFPKWSFGLFQSQDRYKTQAEVLSVAANYRKNHLPVDVIVQDWYYWEPLPIGSHVMNPINYPNPKAMVDELHKQNLHAMISIWPVYGVGSPTFDAMKKIGGITDIDWDNPVTHTKDLYYDVYNPRVTSLYWAQTRDSLIKRYDWDAWWIDQCEPDNNGKMDERRKTHFFNGRGIDNFNNYSLAHTTGIYSGWRNDIPNKRAFFLVRQAFAGQQRNATTLWSSDITCTFRAFKSQVPQGINSCASGIPYWTSDIGGYHLNWNAPNWSTPANRELFTRWFQFGTFCPIFRIHGKGERALFSDNWDAATKATLLHFDKLRYRLLPYIYSLAGHSTTDNYTMMRSLAFDFPTDPKIQNIPDQYMFGPAFLVNPVTEQLFTGAGAEGKKKERSVYLPGAGNWYDFWTGKTVTAGQTIDVPVPVSTMPLYVRAGSIIPMGPDMQYATEKVADTIERRIYPGADGRFTFYEDEGDTYNYEKGKYAQFTIDWNDKTRQLSISDTKGSFTGMLKKHIFNIVLVKENHGVDIGFTTADKLMIYLGKAIQVRL